MQKVKITLPATVTNLGPGLQSLGLALALHTTVEITERADEALEVETSGEGAGRYSVGWRHPVVLGMIRLFQKLERAPLGMTIKVDNQIPVDSGLGAETAFQVAGVIGANNLLGNVYRREQIVELSAQITQQLDGVITALRGGLTASLLSDEGVLYRNLPVAALKVVVALPELPNYSKSVRAAVPERFPLQDVLHDLRRMPLLLEGLRAGDHKLIGQTLADKLHTPHLTPHITGFKQAEELARRAGAQAVTVSGDGPALLAFAESNHRKVSEALEFAFQEAGVRVRTWILPVDTQGVVVSVAQSA